MAINYQKVGWDTTKYFNPTNMHHMDDGIKAACDKSDANEASIADVNSKLGNTDISAIGDGTLTGGLNALNSNLCHKANSKIALEYDGTTENKDFNVLDLFGDTRGIYLISSACDYYKASYGVWLVGLSKSSNQNFITNISSINASLKINSDRTLTFNANYLSTQHYAINVVKLA